jgi:antitoxin VapB
MSGPSENKLREAHQLFKHAEPADDWPGSLATRARHAKPMLAKVFKSGNSLALRLPAALGLEAGMEMELMPDTDGGYSLRLAPPAKRKINVDKFWGILPDLEPLKPEDRIFEPVKRPWDDPDWPGWGDDET